MNCGSVSYQNTSVSLCILSNTLFVSRSQWPRRLRRRSAAARLLRLWVRIPPGSWRFVCCECCVLSDRGLCDELITLPEEFYSVCCVVLCALETSWIRRPWPTGGCRAKNKHYWLTILSLYSVFWAPDTIVKWTVSKEVICFLVNVTDHRY